MKKLTGYILAIIGIIALAVGIIKPIRDALKFVPAALPNSYIIILGAILLIIGILLALKRGKSKSGGEVPIYQGKQIVGYRRV